MQKKQKITAVKARLKLILPPAANKTPSFGRQTVICSFRLRSGINFLTPFFQGGL
jgi:hypothetical protein